MKPKIVSIYSGVGGIDIGFEEVGFETVFATDIWDRACESFKVTFPKSDISCENITEVNFKKIKSKHGTISGLIGGPPCPPFSKSRFYRKEKPRGINDTDGFITISNYFRAVKELNPRFFFLKMYMDSYINHINHHCNISRMKAKDWGIKFSLKY